jgi:hypothetical protein
MEEKLIEFAGADGFFSSQKGLCWPDRRYYYFLEDRCYCGNAIGFLQVLKA